MSTIEWKVDFEVWERISDAADRLDNTEITAEEYREELAMLPGYPLPRLLESGDDLKITFYRKARSIYRPQPRPSIVDGAGRAIYKVN